MESINTLVLTLSIRAWLTNSRHPRILHVFDHACNLVNERREVLSIVTPQIGNGPFNLMIEYDFLFSDHLTARSSVSIGADQLRLGDLTINTNTARLWSPRPDWQALHAHKDVILDELILLPVANYQPALPISLLANFACAMASLDIPAALRATRQLAGLGQGLTPAGDDYILGSILAALIIHPPSVAIVLADEITNAAAPRTTSLSAAWLRSAGRGEAGILWHKFFEALLLADPVPIQDATDNIIATGESSGTDALTGFVSTFISFGKSEAKLCLS